MFRDHTRLVVHGRASSSVSVSESSLASWRARLEKRTLGFTAHLSGVSAASFLTGLEKSKDAAAPANQTTRIDPLLDV